MQESKRGRYRGLQRYFVLIKRGRKMKVRGNLQFKDENHFVLVFVCVVEVDELVMVQVVHDVNLFPDVGQRSGHLHNSILLAFYNL